ncbi:MAG: hypothetical protein KC776_35555 [Myxococcales bacterium]|nr:hypothetical protein [Myxococcales bacterium]MCB9578613.1 hypothetical protein [Polyangiaceae bacterium]
MSAPLLIALAMTLGFSLPSDREVDARAGAWDASVQAENDGNVQRAREILAAAWSPEAAGYEVTVRLAWLSFRLGDLDAAERLYQRARSMDGAGPEATQGLAATHARRGFIELHAGDVEAARASFRAALTINPRYSEARRGLSLCRTHPFDLEFWIGGYSVAEPQRTTGALGFAHLRLRPSQHLRLRAAYRFQGYWVEQSTDTGPGFQGGRSQTKSVGENRHELWAGGGVEATWLGVEALGLWMPSTDQPTLFGQAARLRLGERVGVSMEQAVLGFRGEAGYQLAPAGYAWMSRSVAANAGARFTHDAAGGAWAAEAGLSLFADPAELYLSGRVGRARWPVAVTIPSVLGVDGDVRYGGTLTLMFGVSEATALGINAEVHRLETADGDTTYFGAALGLRLSPPVE